MQNPFSWLFRQIFGKRGPAIQKAVNNVLDPVVLSLLENAGLPVTLEGAKQLLGRYAAGRLRLSPGQLSALYRAITDLNAAK